MIALEVYDCVYDCVRGYMIVLGLYDCVRGI
jgi:hypothetical protein